MNISENFYDDLKRLEIQLAAISDFKIQKSSVEVDTKEEKYLKLTIYTNSQIFDEAPPV